MYPNIKIVHISLHTLIFTVYTLHTILIYTYCTPYFYIERKSIAHHTLLYTVHILHIILIYIYCTPYSIHNKDNSLVEYIQGKE